MKRVFTMFLIVVMIALAALSASAYTVPGNQLYQSADSSGVYQIHWNEHHADITFYSGANNYSYRLDLNYRIGAVCAYNGKIVLFCDDSSNNQLYVYVYYLESDILDSFGIYGAKLYDTTDFSCDEYAIYIENHLNTKELQAYSYDGMLLNRFSFDDTITSISSGYRSGIYVVSDESLFLINNGKSSYVSGASVAAPLFPANDHILVSPYGKVYMINGNQITDTFTVDTDYKASSACVIDDVLYYPHGSMIYGYDINSGDKICSYQNDFNPTLLFTDNDQILAISDGNSILLDTADFLSLLPTDLDEDNSNKPSSSGSNSNSNNNSKSGSKSSNRNIDNNNNNQQFDISGISSDVYSIDFTDYYITGIAPETTVAAFKSNMKYDGYSLSIYRGNTLKKSGNVGTAMTAVFESNTETLTFELSITGDITGEGNSNSRDLNLLMDYLIGAVDYNGVYMIASDVYSDSQIDVRDLAVLKRNIS